MVWHPSVLSAYSSWLITGQHDMASVHFSLAIRRTYRRTATWIVVIRPFSVRQWQTVHLVCKEHASQTQTSTFWRRSLIQSYRKAAVTECSSSICSSSKCSSGDYGGKLIWCDVIQRQEYSHSLWFSRTAPAQRRWLFVPCWWRDALKTDKYRLVQVAHWVDEVTALYCQHVVSLRCWQDFCTSETDPQ